jgi:hypothetical protein
MTLKRIFGLSILMATLMVAMTGFYACEKETNGNENGNASDETGDGSAENPFLVANIDDLKRVGSEKEGPGGKWKRDKHYLQVADINLQNESNWAPIGGVDMFTGTYDGDGYTISNLTIVGGDERKVGLFAYLAFGTIQNVRLTGVSISGKANVGAIAGEICYKGTIDHCYVNIKEITGGVTDGTGTGVGGIAGLNFTGTISNCIVTGGKIDGTGNGVGGVAGYHNEGIIENCYTTTDIIAHVAGGIAGDFSNGIVQYCYATGSVTGGERNGGIVGNMNPTSTTQNCVALNNMITGGSYADVGRVIGKNYNDKGTIINNYARIDMVLMSGSNTLTPTNISLDGIDGANVTKPDYCGANSDTWWNSTAGFPSSAWSFDKNRLPWLKGFDGLTQNPTIN